MIILDTNVVSELMRPVPAAAIPKSLSKYSADELYTTSITLAEILYGIEILPAGKRKSELLAAAERLFQFVLEGRLLPFDEPAAREFSHLPQKTRTAGGRIGRSNRRNCIGSWRRAGYSQYYRLRRLRYPPC